MSFSQKRRRIKPFARPTSFDINVAFDLRHYQHVKFGKVINPLFPTAANDEAFHALEGEILMQNSSPGVRRYGDHQMHVFSFANGLQGSDLIEGQPGPRGGDAVNVNSNAPDKAKLLNGLKYAGVAVTDFSPEKDVFEQGFVMTVAGLNTLFNNGDQIIYPGDVICADVPNSTGRSGVSKRSLQTGVPRDKIQFVITPFHALKKQVGEELAARFIMGTALSYSRSGTSVDVVLHRCNTIIKSAATVSAVNAEGGENGGGFMGAESSSKKIKKKSKK